MAPQGPDAPEQRARQKIDAALVQSGWVVQAALAQIQDILVDLQRRVAPLVG